jgi:hypothetical protein
VVQHGGDDREVEARPDPLDQIAIEDRAEVGLDSR